jgi:outer membrane protein insertion porin family
LPFFKNYYAGGPGSVRGYRPLSLGPLDPLGNALGGNRRIVGSAEILFPVPGADQDKSLRLGSFIDGGQVYGRDEKLSLAELRYSAGIALSWSSPFGPLRISLGWPLNEKKGIDRVQRLQLTIGTGF